MPNTVQIGPGARGYDFTALTPALKVYLLNNRPEWVSRYLPPYKTTYSWKAATPEDHVWCDANGIPRTPIYEGRAAEALDGAALGTRNGKWAIERAYADGYPAGVAITACCDTMPRLDQMPAVVDYFAHFYAELGPYGRGLYAPSAVAKALIAAGIGYDRYCVPGARSWSPDIFAARKKGQPYPIPVHMIQGSGPGGGIDVDSLEAVDSFAAWYTHNDPPTPSGEPRPPHARPVLKYSRLPKPLAYRNHVRLVQHILGVKPESGLFLSRTKAAVIAFQKRHGLYTDGVVGSQTWAAFDRGLR